MGAELLVTIYADGGCRGNPGPGGWGVVLQAGDYEKELWGGEPATTNNRMEMTAAIRALEALKKPATVQLHTDSQYLQKGISEWIHNWKRNIRDSFDGVLGIVIGQLLIHEMNCSYAVHYYAVPPVPAAAAGAIQAA